MKFLLGKKLNMSQVFTEDGKQLPATVLEMGPCKVVQVKTVEKDGYSAVQLGFGSRRKKAKAASGHGKGMHYLYLNEFRVDDSSQFKVGDEISVKQFEVGDIIDVSGVMKGRGFAGAMKRHGFHGFPATHGHDHPRMVGSIGSMFPQHVRKGKRMAGRMGGEQVSVKNLIVLDIDPEKNLLWVMGSVPGSRQGMVRVKGAGEKAAQEIKIVKHVEMVEKKEDVKSEPEKADVEKPANSETPKGEKQDKKEEVVATESKKEEKNEQKSEEKKAE